MHSDPKLTEHMRLATKDSPLKERVMFGGVAFFLNGNMCCGIYHKDLILRIGEDRAEAALKKPHVTPMDITGKPMRGWIKVAPAGCNTKHQLDIWIGIAQKFVGKLPAKKSKTTSKRKKKK